MPCLFTFETWKPNITDCKIIIPTDNRRQNTTPHHQVRDKEKDNEEEGEKTEKQETQEKEFRSILKNNTT